MKKVLTLLLLLFSFLSFSQNYYNNPQNKAVPTFFGSSENLAFNDKLLDIYNKTQLHISNKSDSLFIKRMKLKENDSLQFQLSYLINKSGYIVADSTAINSGIASFDNYIKLMVKSLPKFTPAVSLITKEHSEYKINILCEFVVKNNKLMIFEKNKIDNFEDPITPIFEACAKDTAVKKNCLSNTYKTIAQKIDISKLSFREALNEIKIMVVFSIDEHGKATDIKILRSSIESKELENKIIEAFLNLPKFYIPTDDPNFHKKKISLPITFQINNTGYSGRPYRNSNGYH